MKSFDTNILFYAVNRDCPEFEAANAALGSALARPDEWCLADQTLFELYRLLRNATVLQRPLSGAEASDLLLYYREKTGWHRCAWELPFMNELVPFIGQSDFPPRRFFDVVLAITLKRNGVKRFYTRNVKDFEGLDFFEVVNPID